MAGRRFAWRAFDELTVAELYALLQLRSDVFVVEQACAFREIDGRDAEALHLLAWIDEAPGLAGCLRVIPPGVDGPLSHIGRVATAARARRIGLGRGLMLEAIGEIGRRFGAVGIEVAAQTAVAAFYASLGFARISQDFDEDGIAHCHMRRSVPSQD